MNKFIIISSLFLSTPLLGDTNEVNMSWIGNLFILRKLFVLIGLLTLTGCGHGNKPQDIEAAWKMGGKIHFEEKSGSDYLGLDQINRVTRGSLKSVLNIAEDNSCANIAKPRLIMENGNVKITHYEERANPGVGEEMHATLLYTHSRGFQDSETLYQVRNYLFNNPTTPPTIECVASKYNDIIKPSWRFKISGIKFSKNKTDSAMGIMAMLLVDGHERIYYNNYPISAGLHLTLAITTDDKILKDQHVLDQLIYRLNEKLCGKLVKVAEANGVADLEFGLSGHSWRLRALKRVEFNK